MSTLLAGIFNATSGCILPQLEAKNNDLQVTEDEGSWFGNTFWDFNYKKYEIVDLESLFSWTWLRDGYFRLSDRRLPLRALWQVLSLTKNFFVCFFPFTKERYLWLCPYSSGSGLQGKFVGRWRTSCPLTKPFRGLEQKQFVFLERTKASSVRPAHGWLIKQKKMVLVTRAAVWQEILFGCAERYGALCPSDNGTGSKLRSPDGWTLHSWVLCRSNPRRCTHLRQVRPIAHYSLSWMKKNHWFAWRAK